MRENYRDQVRRSEAQATTYRGAATPHSERRQSFLAHNSFMWQGEERRKSSYLLISFDVQCDNAEDVIGAKDPLQFCKRTFDGDNMIQILKYMLTTPST